MILRKLRQVLIDVEDYGNGNDEEDGEEIRTDKLLYDIPVESADVTEYIQLPYPSEITLHKCEDRSDLRESLSCPLLERHQILLPRFSITVLFH